MIATISMTPSKFTIYEFLSIYNRLLSPCSRFMNFLVKVEWNHLNNLICKKTEVCWLELRRIINSNRKKPRFYHQDYEGEYVRYMN